MRLFILLSAAMLCMGVSAKQAPITVIVMDSANALLPDVQITSADLPPFTTSFDGRYVIGQVLQKDVQLTLAAAERDTIQFTLLPAMQGQTIIIRMGNRHATNPYLFDAEGVVEDGSTVRVLGYSSRSARKSKASARKAAAATAAVDMSSLAFEAEDVYEEAATADGSPATGEMMPPAGTTNHAPQAGMLTAGEVNDFAKWALWPKLLDGSHKAYLRDWRMVPRNRYVLQLTNQDGYPIVDRSVCLTDAQGNTLFQARTDNTGKAELWDGLFGQAANGSLKIHIDGQSYDAHLFDTDRLIRISLNEPCEAPDVADVFFIFDATGSMGDELRYLQAEMQDVINRSQSAVAGLHIRTGALVYRDQGDEYLTRISRLSDSIATTQAFISAQQANGGGDYEEAIPEALMAAIHVADWSPQARARIAFLILDAPCHQDARTIQLLHEQTLHAAAAGIRLVPVVCSGLRESGELLMRSLALITNGSSFFLTDDSGIGGTHLKPTTDTLQVEHLNDMLVRTIISFTRMPQCDITQWAKIATDDDAIEQFLPQPFDISDLDTVPTTLPELPLSEVLNVRPNPCTDYLIADLPQGCDALYLQDLTGKTIQGFGPQPAACIGLQITTDYLASGVYFLKAFYGGRWYSRKVIVM